MSMANGHISDGRRIRAFTLVEVIVVMVIVGVVTGTQGIVQSIQLE